MSLIYKKEGSLRVTAYREIMVGQFKAQKQKIESWLVMGDK